MIFYLVSNRGRLFLYLCIFLSITTRFFIIIFFFVILLFFCCFVELALGIAIILWIKTETVTARDTCVCLFRDSGDLQCDLIGLHCIRKCSIEFTFHSLRRVTHEIFVFVKRVGDFLVFDRFSNLKIAN